MLSTRRSRLSASTFSWVTSATGQLYTFVLLDGEKLMQLSRRDLGLVSVAVRLGFDPS